MSKKRRDGLYYSLDEMPSRSPNSYTPERRRSVPVMVWILIACLLGGGAFFVLSNSPLETVASYLPFPKKLIAVRMKHNGQEVILLPDSQGVINPRDSLQLLEAQTDGWVSWGVRVVSSDVNVEAMREKAAVIRDLMPKENFDSPKAIEFRVLLWNRPIGKVDFLVQLDAKDWMQKANAVSDPGQRLKYLEKVLQENSENVLVKTQLAGLYFEKKMYDEAARLYREINEAGKSRDILEHLLEVYQRQNKVDDALAVYLDLLKLTEDPEQFKGFLQYVQKRKSRDEAVRFIERNQEEIPKTFHSSLLLVLADLNTQASNWDKAAASYEKAIKAGVKDPDILYNLAVTYQQGDDPEKAISALERYLQKNPSDTKSWMQLAGLYEKKGAPAKARETYEMLLKRNPQHRDAQLRLVALLEKSGDKGALETAYEKLIQTQPKNRTLQNNLAVLYYEGKKWDKAAAAFEALAAQDPKDIESRKYLLDLYRKLKNDKAELDMLESLAKTDPKNSAYIEALFKEYDSRKDYKSIVRLFKTASEQNPDSSTFHSYLLYGYLKTGDQKGALGELEHLIRLQPKEKKYIRQAASLYESTKNYPEALKKLDQLIALDPKDKEAKEDYLRLKMSQMGRKKQE